MAEAERRRLDAEIHESLTTQMQQFTTTFAARHKFECKYCGKWVTTNSEGTARLGKCTECVYQRTLRWEGQVTEAD